MKRKSPVCAASNPRPLPLNLALTLTLTRTTILERRCDQVLLQMQLSWLHRKETNREGV